MAGNSKENEIVTGAENSLYAELAGEGPGPDQQLDSERQDLEGRQEAQATIRSNPLGKDEGMPKTPPMPEAISDAASDAPLGAKN